MNHPDHNGPPSHPNGGMGGHVHHHQHHRPPQPHNPDAPPPKWHSYKMLVDPSIHRGAPKMMRYDGLIVPGNPHHVPPTLTDPRNKPLTALWRRIEPMDLSVPKFKIDENYVGEPPKVEVTVENMNDNIDEHFLRRLVEKCGLIENLTIYYHPVTGKHLGLAHLCFEEVKSAKNCCEFLHGKSVMGQVLSCLMDPLAKSCIKTYTDLTEEKKPEPLPLPPAPIPPLMSNMSQEGSAADNQENHGFSTVDDDRSDISPMENSETWDAAHHYRRRGSQEDPRKQHMRGEQHYGHQSQPPPQREQSDDKLQPPLPYPNDERYHSTIFNPNYWQQQAQQYAAMHQQPPPPPAPVISSDRLPSTEDLSANEDQSKETPKDDNDENESEHQVDLDTRLKMLMKNKSGGAMPSFLLNELNGSEEDDSDKEIKDLMLKNEDSRSSLPNSSILLPQHQAVFVEEPPLSRPPSPFLSERQYLKCHNAWQAERKSKYEKSLEKISRNSPSKSDDRMSLSSLSSAENNILTESLNMPLHYGYPPPPIGYDPGAQQYQDSWYTHHYMHNPQQWPSNYPHHHQSMQYPHYDHQKPWQDPYEAIKESLKSGKSSKNVFRPFIKRAVDEVVQDLTRILTKDIKKRMCETVAFYHLDKWWMEQETKYKEKHSKVPSSKPSTSIEKIVPIKEDAAPKMPIRDISTLFDRQRESMDTTGLKSSTGFGFRGTIPKLPAFKIKKKAEDPSVSKKSSKDKKDDSSDDETEKSSKKSSEKRRDQEKRREERLKEKETKKKSVEKEEKPDKKSPGVRTLSSIYSTLYSDTDESKDTEEDGKISSSKESDKEKKLKKKRSSPPSKTKSKKKASSVSSIVDSSSGESEIISEESSEEVVRPSKVKPASKNKDSKKAVIKSDALDESSQGSSSLKKSAASASSSTVSSSKSSSSSTSASASSSSSSSSEDETEKAPKPAPVRRASETLTKTDQPKESTSAAKLDIIAEEEEPEEPAEEPAEELTPSHIDEDHCYARPSSEQKQESETFENQFANDHGYTRPRTPPSSVLKPKKEPPKVAPKPAVSKKVVPVKPVPTAPRKLFKQRPTREEFDIIYKFLTKGIDLEDIKYFKISYNMMLEERQIKDVNMTKMLNYTHWVDHSMTDFPEPPKKKRKQDFSKPHLTGSARTEGYYKMDPREKARTKYHLQRPDAMEAAGMQNKDGAATQGKIQTAQQMSREARSTQRRQLAVLGDQLMDGSDLLKFNQLKFRRKNLTFGKSSIHDWGLFAREYIGADEMVIEYVGHVVRPVLSDVRESRYEKQGIGSSYLFRIDQDYVVDATKCGNLARFINHSCDPNCYAKIITIDGEKKIVIYSKQPIAFGEEITYDYKFPIEDEKIRCLCGTKNCRKYLN